jgi:hypothetical protein
MKESRFESRQLSIKDSTHQSGPIENRETARIMAEEEERHRSFARYYDEYRRDPKKFATTHPELSTRHIQVLRTLSEENVPSEYVRRYGELRAEMLADVYDFRACLQTCDNESLWDLRDELAVSGDKDLILAMLLSSRSKTEYDLQSSELSDWLTIVRDAMKLGAAEDEIVRRCTSENTRN